MSRRPGERSRFYLNRRLRFALSYSILLTRSIEMITRHLRIRGRVQGVGFRMYMQREAQRLGVSGWVRNRQDGSVEAIVHGEPDIVEALIAWARHGPPSARVTHVDETAADEGTYEGFEQRTTQ
jgi:acylphosphatase